MKKQNRLSKIVGKQNEVVFTSHLFNIRISDGEKSPKFGFVVSKSVNKSAVLRNKTKRILRRSVEEILEKVQDGKDIVIIAKKNLEQDQKKEIQETLVSIFTKAKILK